MMRFAEERGEVRRDRVTELDELLAGFVAQELAVIAEAVQIERPQAARDAPVNELPLLVGEVDAGVRFHQRPQRVEVLVAEREFARFRGTSCRAAGDHGGGRERQKSSTLPSSGAVFAAPSSAVDLAGAHQQVEQLMVLVRAQAVAQHAEQLFPALRAEAGDARAGRERTGRSGGS